MALRANSGSRGDRDEILDGKEIGHVRPFLCGVGSVRVTDMTKFEFLQQLYDHLSSLPSSERDDIVTDFEEHFQAGEEQGKTDEQICAELGNPYACAMQYLRGAGGMKQPTAGGATQSAPMSAPSTATPPPYPQNRAAAAPRINERRNKTLWAVVFFIALVCAVGAYPTACALMLVPIALFIASFFLIPAVPGGAMIGFLISLGVLCFTGGLLLFLIMTWLLRTGFRRAGF